MMWVMTRLEVCDYSSGHRKMRSFADYQAALLEAQRLARLLASQRRRVPAALLGQDGRGPEL